MTQLKALFNALENLIHAGDEIASQLSDFLQGDSCENEPYHWPGACGECDYCLARHDAEQWALAVDRARALLEVQPC